VLDASFSNQLKAVPSKHGIHEIQVSMEVSIVMANPQEPDGLFHGKAYEKWMRTGGTPMASWTS